MSCHSSHSNKSPFTLRFCPERPSAGWLATTAGNCITALPAIKCIALKCNPYELLLLISCWIFKQSERVSNMSISIRAPVLARNQDNITDPHEELCSAKVAGKRKDFTTKRLQLLPATQTQQQHSVPTQDAFKSHRGSRRNRTLLFTVILAAYQTSLKAKCLYIKLSH